MPTKPHLPTINVVLVEDDLHFQQTFEEALATARDMHLVTSANTKARALSILNSAPADILVVDLGLPDGSGIDVIRAAQTAWPQCGIMVSTTFGDELHVIQSIEAGASGYLLKDSNARIMVDEIRCLNSGGSPISPLIARHLLKRFRQSPSSEEQVDGPVPVAPSAGSALSAREHQVLLYITKGFNYEEIAGLMQISRHTVLSFVRRIYSKLEVKSKAEAIYEARIQGLLVD